MTEEIFKLPRSSYEELVKIIQAYGARSREATIDEIATVVAINRTIISGNNGFLLALGIIEGGPKKIITKEGRELSRALDHNMSEDISRLWRSFLLGNEFLQKILSAVRIRKGMDIPTLQSHITYSAGQPKNTLTATGAMAVINIFKIAGMLVEDNGKILPVETSSIIDSGEVSKSEEQKEIPAETVSQEQLLPAKQVLTQHGNISFSITLQIQCTIEEIDSIAPKIKNLIKELSQEDPSDSQD